MHKKLSPQQVKELLAQLPDWRHDAAREAIIREFEFQDFDQAFAFMTRIALAAAKNDHHPEWTNVYNRVTVIWSTHDVGGLTERDLALARCCDEAFDRVSGKPAAH